MNGATPVGWAKLLLPWATTKWTTSNLGAAEMNCLLHRKLGFAAAGATGEKLDGKAAECGIEAARRKFTPEFINRLDKIVVFKALGTWPYTSDSGAGVL